MPTDETLVATLQCLFAGRSHEFIAETLCKVVSKPVDLLWAMVYQLPVSMAASIDADFVLEDLGEYDPPLEYTGTPEQLKQFIQDADWGDSDIQQIVREEVIEKIKAAGLIRNTVTHDAVTPT